MSDEVTTNEVEQKVNVTDTQGASDGREGEEKGCDCHNRHQTGVSGDGFRLRGSEDGGVC